MTITKSKHALIVLIVASIVVCLSWTRAWSFSQRSSEIEWIGSADPNYAANGLTPKPKEEKLKSWALPERSLEPVCAGPVASYLRDDPCLTRRRINGGKACDCDQRNFTLRLPPVRPGQKPLSKQQIRDETIFAFIHVNKAGGQSIKHVLFDAASREHWDGAGYGTYEGWKLIPRGIRKMATVPPAIERGVSRRRLLAEPYLRCGNASRTAQATCDFRTVWGGLTMGLCDIFAPRPCVYLLNVRDPVHRAISEYNYFCVNGAEGRRRWLPEWKANDLCPLSIVEYLEAGFSKRAFLTERLTRGCDSNCGIEVAKENLRHPCVRYFVLEDLRNDVKHLLNTLPDGALSDAFQTMLEFHKESVHNAMALSERTREQIEDPSVIQQIEALVQQDIEVYNYAIKLQAEKWTQPLYSCNIS